MPRPTRSVATRIRLCPSLKPLYLVNLSIHKHMIRWSYQLPLGLLLGFIFPWNSHSKHQVNLNQQIETLNRYIPLLLWHSWMDTDGRKVALHQQFIQLCSTAHTLHKDDNLIEVERIQQVIELPILLHLTQLDVVLHIVHMHPKYSNKKSTSCGGFRPTSTPRQV